MEGDGVGATRGLVTTDADTATLMAAANKGGGSVPRHRHERPDRGVPANGGVANLADVDHGPPEH